MDDPASSKQNSLFGYETGTVVGDLLIETGMILTGIVLGSVTVANEGDLVLRGTIGKDLIVLEGGRAKITGVVGRDIINQGGFILVDGLVLGRVHRRSGKLIVTERAKIVYGV